MLTFLLSAFAANGVMDRIAAVVDDEVITLSEVYELGGDYVEQSCPPSPMLGTRCELEAELEILDVLIKRTLIKAELEELRLTVGAIEVDQTIDQIARDNGLDDRTALRNAIEESGVSWNTYRQQIREELQVQRFQQRVLFPRVSVADDELRDLYDRTARGESVPTVRIDAIGVVLPPERQESAIQQSKQLVASLNAGEVDWDVAKERFDGASVNAALGDKPYKKGQLTPALDAVVFEAPIGQFLEPIRVGDVMMIVRVLERSLDKPSVKPYAEVAPALRNQLLQKKLEDAEEAWYQRKRRESAIRILLSA